MTDETSDETTMMLRGAFLGGYDYEDGTALGVHLDASTVDLTADEPGSSPVT